MLSPKGPRLYFLWLIWAATGAPMVFWYLLNHQPDHRLRRCRAGRRRRSWHRWNDLEALLEVGVAGQEHPLVVIVQVLDGELAGLQPQPLGHLPLHRRHACRAWHPEPDDVPSVAGLDRHHAGVHAAQGRAQSYVPGRRWSLAWALGGGHSQSTW